MTHDHAHISLQGRKNVLKTCYTSVWVSISISVIFFEVGTISLIDENDPRGSFFEDPQERILRSFHFQYIFIFYVYLVEYSCY